MFHLCLYCMGARHFFNLIFLPILNSLIRMKSLVMIISKFVLRHQSKNHSKIRHLRVFLLIIFLDDKDLRTDIKITHMSLISPDRIVRVPVEYYVPPCSYDQLAITWTYDAPCESFLSLSWIVEPIVVSELWFSPLLPFFSRQVCNDQIPLCISLETVSFSFWMRVTCLRSCLHISYLVWCCGCRSADSKVRKHIWHVLLLNRSLRSCSLFLEVLLPPSSTVTTITYHNFHSHKEFNLLCKWSIQSIFFFHSLNGSLILLHHLLCNYQSSPSRSFVSVNSLQQHCSLLKQSFTS